MSGEQINLLADANTQQSSDASKDGHKRIADQVDISTAQGTQVNAGGQATLGGGVALPSTAAVIRRIRPLRYRVRTAPPSSAVAR